MRLDVPFYVQEHGSNDCGPITLKMALEFLGEYHELEELKGLVDSEKSGATSTVGIAKAAAQLGFKTELYSNSLEFNSKHRELDFYKKLDDFEEKTKRLLAECKKLGVKLEEKSLSNKEILSKLSSDCIPIILIDWGKVAHYERYQGHFVPIVGFTGETVFIHQPGPINPTRSYPISMKLFEEARKARGTDEDIVFIYKKK